MKNILKFAFAVAAVFAVACTEKPDNGGNEGKAELVISYDKDVITSDGKDFSTITVKLGGKVLTDGVEFFDADNNPFTIKDFKFSTTVAGDYEFWAAYKTSMSEPVLIKAIPMAIPDAVADSAPENLSFPRRVFITQLTGTGCGYCPGMIKVLHDLMDDEGIAGNVVLAAVHSYNAAGNVVLAAVHSYNANDPAYISAPSSGALGGSGYPFVSVDLSVGYRDYTKKDPAFVSEIQGRIAQPAKAGIAVNPSYNDGYLVTKVSVKAAQAGEFLVGAWLVEDNIYGVQQDYLGIKDKSYDTHNNCVRVVDSKEASFAGYSIGNLEVGQVVDKTFIMKVKSDWKLENMHLVVFTSNPYEVGKYTYYEVNNVVDCPIDAPTPFEYLK